MVEWKINSKKDRIITFLFVLLLIYGVVNGCFHSEIMRFMERFMPDKLTTMNQPGGYGTVIVVTAIMTGICTVDLMMRRAGRKKLLKAVSCGLILCAVTFGSYYGHCLLLVRQLQTASANSAWINGGDNNIRLNSGTKELDDLQALAAGLKPMPKKEQERLRAEKHGEVDKETIIWINFPKKYFHSYSFILRLKGDDAICVYDGAAPAVYYQDNGIVDYVKSLEK